MTQNRNPEKLGNSKITAAIGIKVQNYCSHHNGFSFTTESELDAYKAAYAYRYSDVRVKEAPNVDAWLVQVYV